MTERKILAAIIAGAFAVRALALWITRPEFVGWFNHSYYYWVQVKGLLENGQLPYADLPLLFYFYAGAARLFQLFGLEMQPAIVNSTRLIMSIVPALIAWPAYLIIRRINGSQRLTIGPWLLVAMSAFLPLTFAHMPELLQKNMVGLLLLCGLMFATLDLLDKRSTRGFAGVAALFVLIALTHLGTLAVALLFGLAVLLAILFDQPDPRRTKASLFLVALSAVIGLSAVYLLDPDAFGRILQYAKSSLPHSLLGALFTPDPVSSKAMFLLGVLLPPALTFLLFRIYRRYRESLAPADRIFWLANILLPYLLVLPILDLDIVPRLVLFMPLPLLVVLSYHLRYLEKKRLNQVVVGLACLGIVAMVAGDAMSLIRLYPNKEQIHEELLDIREQYQLTENDFVLTTYAVNPICNWFLGTKSGLITAFNKSDTESYDRLFVLNPDEGRSPARGENPSDNGQITIRTAAEKYQVMRQSIPMPTDLEPGIGYDQLEFYELATLPENWVFNEGGIWIGWVVEKD